MEDLDENFNNLNLNNNSYKNIVTIKKIFKIKKKLVLDETTTNKKELNDINRRIEKEFVMKPQWN